ncbi:MAG: 2,4-dichlorophenol 6-monooxygenase [Kordiimonas sp.]|nr:2,4-dichlorophenol 6-monooxygenase [Kordiimonas sp.]
MADATPMVETEVLIVGAGPAGAGASALLATYGIDNIVINKRNNTAQEPRAHITNQRAVEVFRDLGLEGEVERFATPQEYLAEHVYATSLVGEELGRVKAWGNHPETQAAHQMASPTKLCDLTQDFWEPILLTAASGRGSRVRFNTDYVSHEQDADGVTVTLHDRLVGSTYQVRAKYLIGADGARSQIAEDIGLPMVGKMGLAASMNVVFEADLSHLVAHRPGVLYWLIQPAGGFSNNVLRMVRPWDKWLATYGFDMDDKPEDLTDEMCEEIVGNLIGDKDIPIKITDKSLWTINEMYAEELSKGRVFCMGDAIHRHPPNNGLGANTCIQDAYNLCWKLAMVLKGQAGEDLLKSYDPERMPVGKQIITRANQSLRELMPIYETLGAVPGASEEQIESTMAARKGANADAAAQRDALLKAVELTKYDFDAHGVEMNQRYESDAILPDGTEDPGFDRDPELYYQQSARPGAHVPHIWVTQDDRQVSTFDLCGHGEFSLLTGIGGEAWTEAAAAVESQLGVKVNVHVIGPGQDYEDIYGDWANAREVGESGALLVRPDHFIGWRAHEVSASATDDLVAAMKAILAR